MTLAAAALLQLLQLLLLAVGVSEFGIVTYLDVCCA
jgi:hypothetical protein